MAKDDAPIRTTSPYRSCSDLMYWCWKPGREANPSQNFESLHPIGPGYRARGWMGETR